METLILCFFSPFFFFSELIQNGRLLTLPLMAGDLHSLLPDEDRRRLYVAMKDGLLSTSMDDITQNPRKVRTAGHEHTFAYHLRKGRLKRCNTKYTHKTHSQMTADEIADVSET